MARAPCSRADKVEIMENQNQEVVQALRRIEEHAQALVTTLPAGLPLHRARQIRSMAAHLALQVELEKAGGHLREAANDAARGQNRSPA